MNICDSFIFVVLKWAVLLTKLPAYFVTGGRKGSHMTSVPGGEMPSTSMLKLFTLAVPLCATPPPYIPVSSAGSGTKDAKPTTCLHCTIMSNVNTRNSVRLRCCRGRGLVSTIILALLLLLCDSPPLPHPTHELYMHRSRQRPHCRQIPFGTWHFQYLTHCFVLHPCPECVWQ